MSPPPTSIDGTEITGATIDGQEVQEITIDGQTVFTAELQVPVPASAIARYSMDNEDTSGDTAIDVWGNNDGTINGASTGVAGIADTYDSSEAYRFDGNDDVLLSGLTMGGRSQFSVAGFFQLDTNDGRQFMVSEESGGVSNSNATFAIRADNNTLQAFVYDSGGVIGPSVKGGTISANTPHHATFTFASGTCTLYLDANQVASGSLGTSTMNTGSDPLRLGQRADQSKGMSGELDDWRFYSEELSSQDVSNIYNTASK